MNALLKSEVILNSMPSLCLNRKQAHDAQIMSPSSKYQMSCCLAVYSSGSGSRDFFVADAFVSFVFLISLRWKAYFFLVSASAGEAAGSFLPVASSWCI